MASLTEIYNIRFGNDKENPNSLYARSYTALATACKGIFTEDPTTTNHATRIAYAAQAMAAPGGKMDAIMWALALNETINADPTAATDDQIQLTVNNTIKALAG